MKRIAILGSTGSIGTQTLEVVRQHPDRLRVVGLAAATNGALLKEQASEFGVESLALYDEPAAAAASLPGGMPALIDVATRDDVDCVVVSVAGVIGLLPTVAAIKAGKQIALASKEVLVAGGEVVMPLIREHATIMTPIDSEHSAIFQCLAGSGGRDVSELWLTASGGPFRGRSLAELKGITPQQALNHPTWAMGGKITIDSATLMNKALEMIEAAWLFGVAMSQVKVVIHPQSIIHSMVKFTDGSVLGQMGWPNMCLPIQVALLHPDRLPNANRTWNPVDSPTLTFEAPDEDTFAGLRLARLAAATGQTMPCALNAANEYAANAFLRGECGFVDIVDTVERVMERHRPQEATLDAILDVDKWARDCAKNALQNLAVQQ